MNKLTFIYILLFVLTVDACQQTVWDSPKYQKITLKQGDSTMEFRITDIASTAVLGKKYYCFRNNHIEIIDGGIIGKPLTDEFQVWDQNQNLIAKGDFDGGLKSGKWTRWNEGQMVSQLTFNNGLPNGDYSYFKEGVMVESGKYEAGKKEMDSIATESGQEDGMNLKSDTARRIKILSRFKRSK